MQSNIQNATRTPLVEHFQTDLETIVARTPSEIAEAYRLRYQVYCEERGFEDPSQFPEGMEKDAFDDHSLHALVRLRATDTPLGVVRLILPRDAAVDRALPVTRMWGHLIRPNAWSMLLRPDVRPAEVSRFAVPTRAPFSLQRDRQGRPIQQIAPVGMRHMAQVSLGLIAMLIKLSDEQSITHWLACMEPALARLLRRYGIRFVPIGPVVEYHGKRQPMLVRVADAVDDIRATRTDLYELILHVLGKHRDEAVRQSVKAQLAMRRSLRVV